MNRKDIRELMLEVDRCREELDLLEELDALVKAATLGDRGAVGAIAIAFGPVLGQAGTPLKLSRDRSLGAQASRITRLRRGTCPAHVGPRS